MQTLNQPLPRPQPELTLRQQQMLDYLRDYQDTHARPPTFRDVAQRFGFGSPNAVYCHLRALTRKGFVEPVQESPQSARSIRLTVKGLGQPMVRRQGGGWLVCGVAGRVLTGEELAALSEAIRQAQAGEGVTT